jgi:Aspartyl protease
MHRLVQRRVLSLLIALVAALWAASLVEAAHFGTARKEGRRLTSSREVSGSSVNESRVPDSVSFREVKGRGLLVQAWLNGTGPYTFAIDTGAGVTLISERTAADARVPHGGDTISLGGISGATKRVNSGGIIRTLALGDPENLLPPDRKVLVAQNLPPDIDGILDPTEAYFPLGYSIDMPHRQMEAFNPKVSPLSARMPPPDGTIVHWAGGSRDRRPFVRLGDGRLALLDTGSGFGLAVSQESRQEVRTNAGVRDISGRPVASKRGEPSTVSIGSLTLRSVPTDILFGVEAHSPILLGRDALYPFKIIFDPVNRLIAIQPADR